MALGNLIPLVILAIIVGVGAFIGYSMYVWSNELAARASKKMEKSNLAFTKEGGLRVGVPQIGGESYEDKTQNVLVNIWNNASLPNYKSRLGWNSTQAATTPAPAARSAAPPSQCVPSSSSAVKTSSLSPPAHKASRKRSSSPVPGGWD